MVPTTLLEQVKKIIHFLGLRGSVVTVDEQERRISITVDEDEWFIKVIPDLVRDLKYITSLLSRRLEQPIYEVDINNYRKERERLLIELAKAAATKAAATKQDVRLPAMNAYERRLVHVELSMRPDVKTESIGEGQERSVVVRAI